MIILENIALRRGGKLLFSDVTVTLRPGQKVALTGANGSGKSSLFSFLLGVLQSDKGDARGLKGIRISHMAQETAQSELSATEYVLTGHAELYQILQALAASDAAENFEKSAVFHQRIEDLDGYVADRKAQRILLGLGFSADELGQSVSDFSGGWRIRLNLARALMMPSDLLLLDEPTNHLDLDATVWLQSWLQRSKETAIIISHDRDFIDATCDSTWKLERQQLTSYRGGYSDYERQRAEKMAHQQSSFEKQRRRIYEIESYVRRFRAKATKARQAQSRLKELERMKKVAPAHIDSPFSFKFPHAGKTSDPLITLKDSNLGHCGDTVLSTVTLSLSPGDRIGLLGKNGSGKSTLLRSIAGDIPLISGERIEGAHLRIGYFDQQQIDVLDLDASPLLHLQRLKKVSKEQEIMNFLGGFDFRGDRAREAIHLFSGGEKARLALAIIVWRDPNILVLDEPTNHLDLDMRHALELALQNYNGAILLVSHDRHLLRHSVEYLLLVHNGFVSEYVGDVDSYEQWILGSSDTQEYVSTSKQDPSSQNSGSQKTKRRSAAKKRAQLDPLKKTLKKLESAIERNQQQLTRVQEKLSNNHLYETEKKKELNHLIAEERQLKQQLLELENNWISQQEILDSLEEDSV